MPTEESFTPSLPNCVRQRTKCPYMAITSQYIRFPSRFISEGKRYTSFMVKVLPFSVAKMARPDVAPQSNARKFFIVKVKSVEEGTC